MIICPNLFKLLRPAHAVKNLLILFPPFFGHRYFAQESITDSLLAVLSFSMIASVVYVLNDLLDREKDRLHPVKKYRPIASGKVSVKSAVFLMIMLTAAGFALMMFAQGKLPCLLLALVYLGINIAYSLKLKHKPVVEIFILAAGFVLRVYFGGAWFHVTISPWLFLCILSGSLWFAAGKRRNELLHSSCKGETRPVLKFYSMSYLNSSYYLLCGITIVFFALWTILAVKPSPALQFSIPVVIFLLFRYNFIMETTDADGDPVPMLLKDRVMIGLAILFAVMSILGVYGGQ